MLRSSSLQYPKAFFCGFIVSRIGIEADPEKVRAIADFPTPTNITDLRSVLGLVNQLAEFTPAIASTAIVLRPLMSPKASFIWTPDHSAAFSKEHSESVSRLVQCGLRFLSDQTLGIVGSKEEILGCVFTTLWRRGKDLCIPDALSRAPVSDPTFEDTSLGEETSICVRNVVAMKIAIIHAISGPSTMDVPPNQQCEKVSHISHDPILEELRDAARVDPNYVKLVQHGSRGFPKTRTEIDPELLPYWKMRDDLYQDGVSVLYGACVLVPAVLHQKVLERLHDSHCRIEATKWRARQVVWWPAINSDITNTVRACQLCQILLPSQQKEPIYEEDTVPTRPFESASADFFRTAGKSYIVYVDRYSGWPVIGHCGTDTTTAATIRFFHTFFRDLGVPIRLGTDGGPQFTSHDFSDFLRRWGVQHDISTPYYLQSNGHTEAAVKAVKHLIMKVSPTGNIKDCAAFDRGLLEIRNTPRLDGRSPAQILYGRQLRSCVPAHAKSFATEWQTKIRECDRCAAAQAFDAVARYNTRAKPLPPVKIGSYVRIQNPVTKRWDKVGTIMTQG
ncbi:uncharacterized protein LOC119584915 [Penaeus monodon]|uniref:uncharacterized protein LOC119584915 n=1 Tax=Penaeus monodon TaxID=6687 RepID=UPI0018A7A2BC|nr:uncharacterized protein LOC119584915 [Penaeus monodon]